MSERAGRKATRGRPASRQPSFYARVVDEADRLDFALAADVNGIDDEIALLRVKIKSVIAHDPDNVKLIMQATNTLIRLIQTRYNIGKKDTNKLKEAIGNVLKEVALPLGIGIGATLNRQ